MQGDAPTTAATFGLRVQPMVHVDSLPESIAFYRALGGRVVFGSGDGDWALVQFEGSTISLLAHPPGDGPDRVELQFVSAAPLDEVEAHVRSVDPALIDRGVAREAFGRMLKLRTSDGLLVKVLELARDLIEEAAGPTAPPP